jgi:hypothetical protein
LAEKLKRNVKSADRRYCAGTFGKIGCEKRGSLELRFNRRHGHSGHVFQGRFKSLLVEEDQYLLPLSRYIHLNPIRPGRFKNADIQSKSE